MVEFARLLRSQVEAGVGGFPKALGKGFLESSAALVTLVISDNLVEFTKNPYYNLSLLAVFAVVAPMMVYSRNRTWGSGFRRTVGETSSWVIGVIAILVLLPQQKQLGLFDGLNLSLYNVLVAYFLFLGVLLPAFIFVLADWLKDSEDWRHAFAKSQRVPSWFDPRYVVDAD